MLNGPFWRGVLPDAPSALGRWLVFRFAVLVAGAVLAVLAYFSRDLAGPSSQFVQLGGLLAAACAAYWYIMQQRAAARLEAERRRAEDRE